MRNSTTKPGKNNGGENVEGEQAGTSSFNQGSVNMGLSDQAAASILNNKFEYFNNKPSQYYNIKFSYYPETE